MDKIWGGGMKLRNGRVWMGEGIGKSEDMKRIEKGVVNSNEEGIKKRGRKVSNKKYRVKNCDFFF